VALNASCDSSEGRFDPMYAMVDSPPPSHTSHIVLVDVFKLASGFRRHSLCKKTAPEALAAYPSYFLDVVAGWGAALPLMTVFKLF
jgi:hypothetical protein